MTVPVAIVRSGRMFDSTDLRSVHAHAKFTQWLQHLAFVWSAHAAYQQGRFAETAGPQD